MTIIDGISGFGVRLTNGKASLECYCKEDDVSMRVVSTTSCFPYLSGDIKICLSHCFLECIVSYLHTFPIFITSFCIHITLIIFFELAQFNTVNADMLE